jgi:hypothetical protein
MNYILPRLVTLFLMVSTISGCSLFLPKAPKVNETWPKGSPWSIQKVIVDQGSGIEKDAVLFKNGIKIEDIAYQLRYIDAFSKNDGTKQIVYLFKGSPCQDCDNIRSLFILNPALGKAKMSFIPGTTSLQHLKMPKLASTRSLRAKFSMENV